MKKEDMRDLPDAAIISNLKLMEELDGIEAREDERDKIEAAQDAKDPSDEDDERNLDTGWGKEW